MNNQNLARDTERWTEYISNGNDYIPIEKWGRDHWSTLLYVEHCAVNLGGNLNNDKMRCNPRVHREFMNSGNHHSSKEYPTRLAGGEEATSHDDWSCVEDMCAAGLIRAWFNTWGCTFGGGKAKVEMCADGYRYANAVRKHKAEGGNYGTFIPE